MNNADRLREAARFMETSQLPDDHATAALLRAVADAHNEACFDPEGGCEEAAAALALADAVLGGGDE